MASLGAKLLLALFVASARDIVASGHRLRSHRAAPALNSINGSSVPIEEPRVPSALENVGTPKKCRFRDVCDCNAAMEFMDCVSGACHGGRHDCHELEYHRACVGMARTCQGLDFECSNRRAVCTITVNMTDPEREAAMARRTDEELREELRKLQKEKCTLEHAMMHHDLLNADNELAKLAPRVQRRMKELQARDAGNIPSFECKDELPVALAPKMVATSEKSEGETVGAEFPAAVGQKAKPKDDIKGEAKVEPVVPK